MNHFRTKRSLMNNTTKHMANMLFFEMLRITFLYKIYDTSDTIVDYSKRTVVRPMTTEFSMRDTDLKGILKYFQDIESSGRVSRKDQILLNQITIDNQSIFRYLRRIMSMQSVGNTPQILLKRIQRDLKIDDPKLRAMFTLVVKWETLTGDDMRLLTERIKNYGLLNMRNSELTKVVNQFAKQDSPYVKDKDKKDNGVTPMDVMMGVFTGMAAKWAHDSRAKNKQSFSRLKDETVAGNFERKK